MRGRFEQPAETHLDLYYGRIAQLPDKSARRILTGPPESRSAGFGGVTQTRMFYVYILESTKPKQRYVGVTGNLKQRLLDHRRGQTKTTARFEDFTLVYYEACLNKKDAEIREKQLKTGFGRGYIKRRLSNYFMDA